MANRADVLNSFLERCEDNDQKILLFLLSNSDSTRRVTRRELRERMHIKDRALRALIAKMRKNGIFIAGDMDKAGYFIPNTFDEYLQFESHYSGRALTTLYTQRQMHKSAAELLLEQTKMEVIK